MRHRLHWGLFLALAVNAGLSQLYATETNQPGALEKTTAPAQDKSQFTILNPTPPNLMRELTPDRPDKTESPSTVDAGHYQIEADLFTYTRNRQATPQGDKLDTAYSVTPFNLRVGLLNDLEANLIVETWTREQSENKTTGAIERHSGFGDITARFKYNIWGNDGGTTALGLIPFAKFPSNQGGLGNKAVEGGLEIPFAINLPLDLSLGTTFGYELNQNQDSHRYHLEASHSISISHDIIKHMEAYAELFSTVSTEKNAGLILTFDIGLAYNITDNWQVDAGANIGLTRAADNWNPFIGMTYRY